MPNLRQAMMGAAGAAGAGPTLDGTVWSWGDNRRGKLGLLDLVNRSSPVQIGSLTTWGALASGADGGTGVCSATQHFTSFAIKTDGTLWAWGYNRYGVMGNGAEVYNNNSPVQIGGLTTWARTSTKQNIALMLSQAGKLYSCGGNKYGQLGTGTGGTAQNRSSPVQIGSLTNWAYPATGGNVAGCVKTDGTLWTWGASDRPGSTATGDTGLNTILDVSSPTQVGSLTNWSRLNFGEYGSVGGIKTDGTLWCWGDSRDGCMGDGEVINRSSPVQVGSLTNWKQLSCGDRFKIAIKTDYTMWAWGTSFKLGYMTGEPPGVATNKSSPVQIGTERDWFRVACTSESSNAVAMDGTLWCWGGMGGGAGGNGTAGTSKSPLQVGTDTDWYDLCGGWQAMQAVK